MHPFLAQRQHLLLYLAAWLIVAVMLAALSVATNAAGWMEAVLFSLPISILYAFICLAAYYLCKAFPLQSTSFLKLAIILLASSFVSSGLWLAMAMGWMEVLTSFGGTRTLHEHFPTLVPALAGLGVLLFLLAIVVHYLMLASAASEEAQRKALELRILAREAELKTLRAQFQPHFLFNSLNSISALTATDPDKARTMLIRLAGLLRKSLELGARPAITLKEELELVDEYIFIEAVRFGNRLNVERQIEERCLRVLVPPLILQPLLENAITHGVGQLLEGGLVRLEVAASETYARLRLTNPFDPSIPQRKGNGMGIGNTRQRVYNYFGEAARLDVASGKGLFTVELTIPLK